MQDNVTWLVIGHQGGLVQLFVILKDLVIAAVQFIVR
jgi:hypothetical protein